MTIAPLIPILSAAAPAAVKAVEALGRLGDSVSFRSLLGLEAESSASEAAKNDSPDAGITQKLTSLLESAGKSLASALRRAGIDLAGPLDFNVDAAGGLSLAADHPQADEIAAALASDPQASARLRDVLSAIQREPSGLSPEQFLSPSQHPQLASSPHPILAARPAALRLENDRLSVR